MTLKQTLTALKKLGTDQNRKVYARHGAGAEMFGVSFADLKTLKKQIGIDHQLAEQLWQTGNVDAMSLATMIADPHAFTAKSADAWLAAIDYSLLASLFGGVIAESPLATAKTKKWTKSPREHTRETGYSVFAAMLVKSPEAVDDETASSYLGTIEQQIHDSPNRARHAMNMALIAVGIYKPSLRSAALEAARRIGKVDVDHGETSCKTPDAIAYINKAVAREKSSGEPTARRRRC